MEIRVVTAGADLETVRALFKEYAAQIGTDLCFQGFSAELAGLPGDYAAPGGTLLLATVNGTPAGCVALRRWDPTTCEMKRLYVRPEFQRSGLGRILVERTIEWSTGRGYERLVLDTLPSMAAAQRLYERLGFVDIEPYRPNPVLGARYMARTLARIP
jgi:putative acetyltransferase